MNDTIQEFFDMIKGDDVFALTAAINQDPALVDSVNENGTSAIMVALYYGRKEIVQLLIQSGAKVDAFTAAAIGDLKRLVKAVEADKSVLAKHSTDGWTPLHLAAYYTHKDLVQYLLDAGSSPLARSTNNLNNHPIHAAAAGKSRDVMALLLERGADVNATQAGGWTPLHAAAQHGDFEMAKLLLIHGADPQARADNGQNALDLAMGKGSQEIVDLLRNPPRIQ